MASDWKTQVEEMLAHLPPGVREEVTAQVIEDTEAGRPFGQPKESPEETESEAEEETQEETAAPAKRRIRQPFSNPGSGFAP